LNDHEQARVQASVDLIGEFGVNLGFPHSSKVAQSKHSGMRELRIQHQGRPYRVLYIFDPHSMAVLLLGGDKAGDNRWYEKNVRLADGIYDDYLAEIEKEKGDAKND
jgi:hypothetical protein